MSASKFSKHQTSNMPRYVVTGNEGEILFTAATQEEFLTKRKEFMDSKASKGLVNSKDE